MPQDDSRSVVLSPFVSPELVLVDERLAASARLRLETHDTLARIARTRPRVVETRLDALAPHEELARRLPRTRTSQPRIAIAAIAAVAVGLSGVLLLTGEEDSARQPLIVAEKGGVPPRSTTGTAVGNQRRADDGSPAASSATRRQTSPERFAWAPVAGASGYHVELFAGAERVFATDTSEARMTIPKKWRYEGELRKLDSGEYRWLVWARVGGVRQSQAIVQARLVVPAR